ncbi:hypothetical protein diail_2884 [Diaporthe ilicicola]|nr:hypothetical protein diail_2884 [Diaporthe ilicicola]
MSFKGLDDRFKPFARDVLFEEEVVDDNSVAKLRADEETGLGSMGTRFPESGVLLRTALSLTEKTRRLPKRLRWVISDRAKMEGLLLRLASMNDFLRDMLDSHQGEILRTQQIRTSYEIIHLNSKMDQLLDIIKASSSPLHGSARDSVASRGFETFVMGNEANRLEPSQDSDLMHHLVKLAQFRAVACAVQGQNLDGSVRSQIGIAGLTSESQNETMVEPSALELDVPETGLSTQETVSRRVTGSYKPLIANGRRTRIWVEWKAVPRDPWSSGTRPEPGVFRRFEALVSLLRENEVTAQFRAPKCLGYLLQRATTSELRYGLVFEVPPGVHPDCNPISLRDLITDNSRPIPSLTLRVRLMRILVECVEKLHAVDWLHKGLRSDNIIFFHGGLAGGDSRDLDFSKPYLSGFEYSRPVTSVSMSEGPGVSLADDLYRHPNVQGFSTDGTTGRGFRKRHDIYSVGLILIEIAYWKHLESILGVSNLGDLKARDVLRVREVLLSQSHIESLQSRVGDAIAEASQACLKGFSGQSEQDGDNVAGAEQLQTMFYE